MDDANWRILLIEDDQEDYLLVKTWLSQAKSEHFSLKWVDAFDDGLLLIEDDAFDVVLVDYQLGSRTGLELIREAKTRCQHVPFILLTGRGSYDVDLTAMEAGASDYLSKAEIDADVLERSIRYAIEQKRYEKELRRAYEKMEMMVDERTEELIDARRKLIESVEQERRRLAQEIHDGPIQDLLGITYLMIGKAESIGEEETLMNLQGAISQAVDSLREVCKELRSSSLAPFNLEDAIRSHARDFQKNHPELDLTIDKITDLAEFPERSRLALYRIYQQAMANIAFHAKARNIDISISQHAEKAVLEVADDGGGFVVPSCLSDLALKGHFGLVGSYERAVAVGGDLQIDSNPGKGTRVRAIVPVSIRIQ